MKILVSAGEASGDRYAAELVEQLRKHLPAAEFFGCAGQQLRQAGVRAVVRAEDLAVVGVFEVLAHIPRIYREFRRLVRVVEQERPDAAILTDAPDFHLRLAKRLHRAGIPVFYYVAPQVWAWRKGRLRLIRKFVDHLLCIFPFEEEYFRERQVQATYVGHPLSERARTTVSREEFFSKYGLDSALPLIALLPGSRRSEAARHLQPLMDAVGRLRRWRPLNFVLPASSTAGRAFFAERIADSNVHIVEADTHNALGHADLALVASGTATVEAALHQTPMVVFYRVSAPSWWVGKLLVDVPYYSMVNLLAGRQVVPEFMQDECRGERLAAEAQRLLGDEQALQRMRRELAAVSEGLRGALPAAERAAEVICERLQCKGISRDVKKDSLTVS